MNLAAQRKKENRLIARMYSALAELGFVSRSKAEKGITLSQVETYVKKKVTNGFPDENDYRYEPVFVELHVRTEVKSRNHSFYGTISAPKKEKAYYLDYIVWDRRKHKELRADPERFSPNNESSALAGVFGHDTRRRMYVVSRRPMGFHAPAIIDHWTDEEGYFYFVFAGSNDCNQQKVATVIIKLKKEGQSAKSYD